MRVGILHVCWFATGMQRPRRTEEGIVSSATGVTNYCELPCQCWEFYLGPLKEQPLAAS